MNISGADIPRSTLAVAAVLWSILFAMQAWHLITTLNMKDRQGEQSGEIKLIASQQAASAANLIRIEDHNREQDKRITILETRR